MMRPNFLRNKPNTQSNFWCEPAANANGDARPVYA